MSMRHQIEGYNVYLWSCAVTGCECDHPKACAAGNSCPCDRPKVCPNRECSCGLPKVCPKPDCECGYPKILNTENCGGPLIIKCSDPNIKEIADALSKFELQWGEMPESRQKEICQSLTDRFEGRLVTVHGQVQDYLLDDVYFSIKTGFVWFFMSVVKTHLLKDIEKVFPKNQTMDAQVRIRRIEAAEHSSMVILHCETEEEETETEIEEPSSSDYRTVSSGTSSSEFGFGFFVHLLVTIMLLAYCVGAVGGCFHRFQETGNGFHAFAAFKTTGVTWAVTAALIYLFVLAFVYFGKKLNK